MSSRTELLNDVHRQLRQSWLLSALCAAVLAMSAVFTLTLAPPWNVINAVILGIQIVLLLWQFQTRQSLNHTRQRLLR